jgi:iron complex outermembrane receptor protein
MRTFQPAAVIGAAMFACFTFAAAGTQAETAARDRSGVIEEIVVTSRRRDESAQDVPLSVTAFNAEAIEQLKPTTLR